IGRPPVFRQLNEEVDLNLEMVEEEPIQREPSVMRQKAFALRRGKWAQWTGKAILALLALALAGTLVFYGVKLVSKIKWGGPKAEANAGETQTYQGVVVAD